MRQNLSNLLKWNDDKEKSLTPIGSLVNLLKDWYYIPYMIIKSTQWKQNMIILAFFYN